jgi:uncharacterized protein (TIGR03663 family)
VTETETASTPETDEGAPPRSRRRGFADWLRNRDKAELAIWAGLIAIAFVLRVWDLGARPFHHDESQDAYFSYTFFKDFHSYEYNPLLHGPFRFYLTALNYKLFGDSNFTARLAPAYMGTLVVALPYLLRNRIGRGAALAAGVIFALSPSYLYFSRFAREDIYLAAIVLALIVACLRYLNRPHTLTLTLIGVLASLAFAVKESGLISVAIIGGFFVLAIPVQGLVAQRRGGRFAEGEVWHAVKAVGWVGWGYALAAAVITYVVVFTVFFTDFTCTTTAYAGHPAHSTSCLSSIFYGLGYWKAQQPVARGSDLAWLYIVIMFGDEWPVVLLAAVGVLFTVRRPTTARLFLIWTFVCTLAFYWWGKERFAWLVLHPLLPLILLAGIGVQSLWQLRSRVARVAACAAIAIGAAYTLYATYDANAREGADPRNLLVSTQSSVQVKQVAHEVEKLNRAQVAQGKPSVTITIDSSSGATFPYAWYFRHNAVGYVDMTLKGYVPQTQVLISTDEGHTAMRPNLDAYAGRRFDFRVWWVKDYTKKFSASAWWHWFTHHRPWNTTGGLQEWLLVRRDLGPVPGKGIKTQIPPPGS